MSKRSAAQTPFRCCEGVNIDRIHTQRCAAAARWEDGTRKSVWNVFNWRLACKEKRNEGPRTV
jgi:hypothetical protein